MRVEKIGGLEVELFDNIEQLPIVRHHAFNRQVMLDAGMGSNLEDIDKRGASAIQMINRGDTADAVNEINNMRAAFINVIENVNPEMLSFAVLVHKIDGVEYNDMSHDGLKKVLSMISKTEISYNMIANIWHFIKKKLRKKSRHTSRQYLTVLM